MGQPLKNQRKILKNRRKIWNSSISVTLFDSILLSLTCVMSEMHGISMTIMWSEQTNYLLGYIQFCFLALNLILCMLSLPFIILTRTQSCRGQNIPSKLIVVKIFKYVYRFCLLFFFITLLSLAWFEKLDFLFMYMFVLGMRSKPISALDLN